MASSSSSTVETVTSVTGPPAAVSALLSGPAKTAQLASSTKASSEAIIFRLFCLNSIICSSLSLRFFFSVANVVATTPAGIEALAAIESSVSP